MSLKKTGSRQILSLINPHSYFSISIIYNIYK